MSGYNADPIGSGHIVEQDGNKYYVGKLSEATQGKTILMEHHYYLPH